MQPKAIANPAEMPNQPAAPAAPAKRKRSRIALFVFLPPAILAGSLIANGAVQASQRGDVIVQAKRALTAAVAKVPFTVRLPGTVPGDARMVRVILDAPDSDQGFQAYQLNVWYRTPGVASKGGGNVVHVWQSNDKFLARRLRDPLQAVGTPVTIGDATWHRVVDDRVPQHVVTTFSKRFDDGITMTVDAVDPRFATATILRLASTAK